MKVMLIALAFGGLVFGAINGAASAEEVGDGKPSPAPAAAKSDLKQWLLKQFDVDGDGQLGEAERTKISALREALDKPLAGADGRVRDELLKRFDQDGDGNVGPEEMMAAREQLDAMRGKGKGKDKEKGKAKGKANAKGKNDDVGGLLGLPGGVRDEIIKRFDKDGDGKLSDVEQAAARAFAESMKEKVKGGLNMPSKEDLLKLYDKDGDGQLSPAERAAAVSQAKGFMDRMKKKGKN